MPSNRMAPSLPGAHGAVPRSGRPGWQLLADTTGHERSVGSSEADHCNRQLLARTASSRRPTKPDGGPPNRLRPLCEAYLPVDAGGRGAGPDPLLSSNWSNSTPESGRSIGQSL